MIDDSWYRRPKGLRERHAAGGVVVRWDGHQILLALARERGHIDYVLPKGHIEAGEKIECAARREIEEEVGVSKLQLVEKLGTKERLDFHKKEWKITHYFLYSTEQIDAVPTDTMHHESMSWVPLDPLPVFFWPEQRALIEENARQIREAVDRKD
ncbi:MAG: NUDIX domain-containing protein [Gemmatimonadota bacterium]|nr:NUDIX domain-containing protein [Gemmatimonadota bacterium]